LLIGLGAAITVAIRWSLFGFHSADMDEHALPWCDTLSRLGFARSMKEGGIDIGPTYIYFLWLVARLPFDRVIFIKTFSVLCDYGCALALATIVYRICGSRLRSTVAAFALLVTPTVVFNSSLWGQIDMVFVAPLIAALAAFLYGRIYVTAALFGLALALKLQAVFLFPLLGIWVVRKQIPWHALLPLPAVFFLALVPARLAGCPFGDLLMVYVNLTRHYSALTLNAPTIYTWLPNDGRWFGSFGLWLAAGGVFMLGVACVRTKEPPSPILTIKEAAAFSCLTPLLLPHMHERYIFLGDVLCVLYAFLSPRHFWVALLVVGASFVSYFPFLFGTMPVPLWFAAVMLAVASVFLTADVVRTLYPGLLAEAKAERS